jgi:hypothetical protein
MRLWQVYLFEVTPLFTNAERALGQDLLEDDKADLLRVTQYQFQTVLAYACSPVNGSARRSTCG